jgi:hypothetical protein
MINGTVQDSEEVTGFHDTSIIIVVFVFQGLDLLACSGSEFIF